MKTLQSICYSGGTPHVLGQHETVKAAKIYFGAFVTTKKAVFVPPIGYIKLEYVK